MTSKIETKIIDECKNKGLNPEEVLQIMEVPYEMTGDSYLFTFDSMSDEELSEYVDYIFRKRWYALDKGTPVDGFYSRLHPEFSTKYKYGVHGRMRTDKYRYKVEIYSSGGKTYLEIFIAYGGFFMDFNVIYAGDNYLYVELNEIVDQIKFLKPSIKGYLICNKCGVYYEVYKDESPDDFPDKCECGGTFEYIAGPEQPDIKQVQRKKTAGPTEYLRAPLALILVSLSCFIGGILYYSNEISFLAGLSGLTFGLIFALMRYRSHELLLNMIIRRLIYFLTVILFFAGSWGLIIIIQFDNYNVPMLGLSLVTVLAIIYGLGMIFKTISPENPRNLLDPPL